MEDQQQLKKKEGSKFRKVMTLLLIFLVTLSSIYGILVWLTSNGVLDEETFWQTFKTWFVLAVIGITVLIVLYWLITNLLDKKGNVDIKIPKEYVGVAQAIEIWKPEFIKNTKIPYYVDYSENKKEGEIKPAQENYVEIKNETRFSEKYTGIPFVRFECMARTGLRKGINLVFLCLDEGLQSIKNNWNLRILSGQIMETYKMNKDYPLTVPQDFNTRLEISKLQQIEEGAKEKELEAFEQLKIKEIPRETVELTEEEERALKERRELEKFEKMSKVNKN